MKYHAARKVMVPNGLEINSQIYIMDSSYVDMLVPRHAFTGHSLGSIMGDFCFALIFLFLLKHSYNLTYPIEWLDLTDTTMNERNKKPKS